MKLLLVIQLMFEMRDKKSDSKASVHVELWASRSLAWDGGLCISGGRGCCIDLLESPCTVTTPSVIFARDASRPTVSGRT